MIYNTFISFSVFWKSGVTSLVTFEVQSLWEHSAAPESLKDEFNG